MIRISTRGRYALRAMVDVAQHGENGPVSRQDIAERQEISADYVAQLFRHLQAAGLIRAGDVVQAVEGPVAVVHCALPCPDADPSCPRIDQCVTHLLWKRVSEAVTDVLNSVTLEDLREQAEQLASEA
jgi:Rrf2 family cysteine metabolism transcriptional repressor